MTIQALSRTFLLALALIALSSCAHNSARLPANAIPRDTAPEDIIRMTRGSYEGIVGLRAMVKVKVVPIQGQANSFDAVVYMKRPDNVRLTGLAMLGVTVFDVVLTGEKFYFYQPSDGYLYTGGRESLKGLLGKNGVDIDPDVIFHSIFFDSGAEKERYFVEKKPDGYDVWLLSNGGKRLAPVMKAEYDLGLGLKRKVFYDEGSEAYLTVVFAGMTRADGYDMPGSIVVTDIKAGYTVTLDVEKYIINPPEGMDGDFTIEGDELKGIRDVK